MKTKLGKYLVWQPLTKGDGKKRWVALPTRYMKMRDIRAEVIQTSSGFMGTVQMPQAERCFSDRDFAKVDEDIWGELSMLGHPTPSTKRECVYDEKKTRQCNVCLHEGGCLR